MFYIDRIHTSAFGAKVNAESAADGIRAYEGLELANYLKPIEKDTVTGSSRKDGRPVLFTVGDRSRSEMRIKTKMVCGVGEA